MAPVKSRYMYLYRFRFILALRVTLQSAYLILKELQWSKRSRIFFQNVATEVTTEKIAAGTIRPGENGQAIGRGACCSQAISQWDRKPKPNHFTTIAAADDRKCCRDRL